jgi:hypothetical protein
MYNMSTNESFVRWQGRYLELRTAFISLIIALSLATLAFVINGLLDKKIILTDSASKCLIFWGCVLLLTCVIMLLLISLNRIESFRKTAQSARKDGKIIDVVNELREETDIRDRITIVGFNLAVIIFAIGEVFVLLGVAIQIKPLFD